MKHTHTFELSGITQTKKFNLEQHAINITLSKMIVYTKEGAVVTDSFETIKNLSLEISTCNSATSLKDVSSIPLTNLIKSHNNGEYELNFQLTNSGTLTKDKLLCNYLVLSIPEIDQIHEYILEFMCSIEKTHQISNDSTLENNVA